MLRYDRQTKRGLVALYPSGQETERVDSYNPGARTGRLNDNLSMKKALGETQTLRAGRSNAEPKFFAPPQTRSRGRRTVKI